MAVMGTVIDFLLQSIYPVSFRGYQDGFEEPALTGMDIGEDVVFAGTRHRGSMEDSYYVSLIFRDKDMKLMQTPRQHGLARLFST
jgi:hypothetical protein